MPRLRAASLLVKCHAVRILEGVGKARRTRQASPV
jgi:hypothetical protein